MNDSLYSRNHVTNICDVLWSNNGTVTGPLVCLHPVSHIDTHREKRIPWLSSGYLGSCQQMCCENVGVDVGCTNNKVYEYDIIRVNQREMIVTIIITVARNLCSSRQREETLERHAVNLGFI